MTDKIRELAARYDEYSCPVFSFYNGSIVYMNKAAGRIADTYEAHGYLIDHILGDILADSVDNVAKAGRPFAFTNAILNGMRCAVVIYPGEFQTVVFYEVYGEAQRRSFDRFYQYASQLTVLFEESLAEVGGIGERIDAFLSDRSPTTLSKRDLATLRSYRRLTQIQLLGRCFNDEPIRGASYNDFNRFCRNFFINTARILNRYADRIILRDTPLSALPRIFDGDEIERMFACIVTGALAMSPDSSLYVSVRSSGIELFIDITSDSEMFNSDNFTQAVQLPESPERFMSNGQGLELLLASEIANRYNGNLKFSMIGDRGVLTVSISPNMRGFNGDGVMRQAVTIMTDLFSQHIIEFSEVIGNALA